MGGAGAQEAPGGRRRFLEGLYEWEWCAGGRARGAGNKGFARRPQRFLEGLYVAFPACGGEWEWEWVWVRAGGRACEK